MRHGSSVAGVADPGAARSFEVKLDTTVAARASPNVSPNVFLAGDRMRRSGFVLADEDVSAPRPSVEPGAGVPGQRDVNFPVEH